METTVLVTAKRGRAGVIVDDLLRPADHDQSGGLSQSPTSSADLLGDDLFEELVRAEQVTLHRRALRLTHDPEAAQDLVQDTLERAYRAFARFRPGSNGRAWLQCIMRNIWISNHRRRVGAMPSVSLDGMDEAGWPRDRGGPHGCSDVEASVVDRLSVASIHTAIEGLPPHLRQVVVLAHVDEAPYGTISETLAIPIGTVASRLSRGRRHLQRVLSDELQGAGALARAG